MYFYIVREVLPTLVIVGASLVLVGALMFVVFAVWKAASQLIRSWNSFLTSPVLARQPDGTTRAVTRSRFAPALTFCSAKWQAEDLALMAILSVAVPGGACGRASDLASQ